MSFNMPVTVMGDVDMGGVGKDASGHLRVGSVYELAQIQVEINTDGGMSEIRCCNCGEELNEADPAETLADGDTECTASDDDGPHDQEYVPLTWAKNIAVSFSEDRDEIELGIATGDPRGGWTFKLRRDPASGVVYMHLPHADMEGPHEPIRELHPGTFVIG